MTKIATNSYIRFENVGFTTFLSVYKTFCIPCHIRYALLLWHSLKFDKSCSHQAEIIKE